MNKEFEKNLDQINKHLKEQFSIYKDKKLEISDCNSFDEFYETKRRSNKDSIIDYIKTFTCNIDEYNYTLILTQIIKEDKTPISYYIFISVEKKLKEHKSLLSLRYEDLKDAKKVFSKYQSLFESKNNKLLLEEVSKDIEYNEWDLY